jgi:hypothetical protein
MLKSSLQSSDIKDKMNTPFSIERLQSRSKLDKRQYRYSNSTKKDNYNRQNDYNTIDNSYSVRRINLLQPKTPLNNDLNNISRDKMSYIPDMERKKAESNFINLINSLVHRKRNEPNIYDNIFLKSQKSEPYKPKGYKYYEYIREHPIIINEDDDNLYFKAVNDLQKNPEIDKNIYNKEKPINLSKSINNKNTLNISSIEENNKIIKLNPSKTRSQKYIHNIEISNNNDNSKLDSMNDINVPETNKLSVSKQYNNNSIDNTDNNIHYKNNNNILPSINSIKEKIYNEEILNKSNNLRRNQKDYKQSDIFYLKNDDLSKNKSSEQYLFKKNYMPQKVENENKNNLLEFGWKPKTIKNKSRIGVSSVAFNILNPSLRGLSPIKKEIDSMNKNNFEKAPIMSEYLDLCKPGELNLRQDFFDKMNDNINVFHRKNYCAAYGDLHHEYKDLVDNMF